MSLLFGDGKYEIFKHLKCNNVYRGAVETPGFNLEHHTHVYGPGTDLLETIKDKNHGLR